MIWYLKNIFVYHDANSDDIGCIYKKQQNQNKQSKQQNNVREH